MKLNLLFQKVQSGSVKRPYYLTRTRTASPRQPDTGYAEQPDDYSCFLTALPPQITYDYLVLALGISLDFQNVEGLIPALEDNSLPICSNYSHKTVEKTWRCIQKFSGGNAVFTFPNSPVKCAGAPQKVMYLFEDYLRRVSFCSLMKQV